MRRIAAAAQRIPLSPAVLALLCALATPVRAGLTNVFLNGFETGMCLWSSVANPEACDGIDNDCDTSVDEDGACPSVCGNGDVESGEACDDGQPPANGDGCSATCSIEIGWQCVGQQPSVCTTVCGDGILIEGVEACDDLNPNPGDGCSASCAIEHGFYCIDTPSVCFSTCGDGIIASNEQCDDADAEPADGCSATCTIEAGWVCQDEPSVCDPI